MMLDWCLSFLRSNEAGKEEQRGKQHGQKHDL
jgi:hypothetical protein